MHASTALERNGVRLACEEAGSGELGCVLVHGWGTDRTSLARQLESLSADRRVVSVDLRGFGESSSPPQKYTIDRYADDVAYVAGKLGLSRYVAIGHCMGGLIALDLAARYAERIAGVVILESFVAPSEGTLLSLRGTLESLWTDQCHDFAARLMTHLLGPRFDPEERARMLAVLASCPRHVLVSAFEGMLSFDSRAAAAGAACPLLYVGTEARYAGEDELRRLCPQLVTERLSACGHYFPLEAPEKLNPLLVRFVNTAERSSVA